MWKIVLAEDEPLLRKALKKILSSHEEYEICFEGTNGTTVLEYLRTHKADILISDIRMPVMDGLELVRKIRQQNASIKIIVLSGYSDFEYARHMLNYNAFSYLLKPVVPEELLETVEKACRQLTDEQADNRILKSHKFQDFQNQGYVHFTSEMPPGMLTSQHLIACCMDFETQPQKQQLIQWQLDFEELLYPSCCFCLDSYLYLVIDLSAPDRDLIEDITEVQLYFEERSIAVRMGIGLEADSMMEVSLSMKQAQKSLLDYQALPYHAAVYYQRISLLENQNRASYPLTEEKELLDAVTGQDEKEISAGIRSLGKKLASQKEEMIFENLTELFFSCKRELSQYRVPLEWDRLYQAIRTWQPWPSILSDLEELLLQCHRSLQTARKSCNTPMVVKAQRYIQEHYPEPLSLEELANYCFLSKSHFCRIFKTETGQTFKAYLNQVRINSAKNLLKTTPLKNYEIAEQIGFDDPSYFNGLFKKLVGMTPNEYRNSVK